MRKVQSIFNVTALLTGLSHVFCCGVPLIVSVLSLLVGLGVLSAAPAGLTDFHDVMHQWEMQILFFSGLMLFFGWSLHMISERIDCHSTGCHHEPCTPKKKKSAKILYGASILFMFNVVSYFVIHTPATTAEAGYEVAALPAHHGHQH